MVRLYHLCLLLLAGLAAATAVAADQPGGKKVTITMMDAAAVDPPGKKIKISMHYADEDRGSDDQFRLDCDDDEPLGLAVKYLLTTLEKQRDYEKASRSDVT